MSGSLTKAQRKLCKHFGMEADTADEMHVYLFNYLDEMGYDPHDIEHCEQLATSIMKHQKGEKKKEKKEKKKLKQEKRRAAVSSFVPMEDPLSPWETWPDEAEEAELTDKSEPGLEPNTGSKSVVTVTEAAPTSEETPTSIIPPACHLAQQGPCYEVQKGAIRSHGGHPGAFPLQLHPTTHG